mmetsp:Transcript_42498/g.122908  ORF Transcript_42498/g.122908 Transcript_42498/m.122908 type:complete len:197 (+) Transcript_42498:93-683(+)
MASGRRTQAASHLALACGVAMWLFAATAFVSTGSPRASGLRGSRPANVYQSLAAQPKDSPVPEQAISWGALVALAAACGLAVSVAATPVQAQEVVEGPRPDDPAAPMRMSKKRKLPKVPKAEATKAEADAGGFKLPSFSVPEATPEVKKVIISPSDEIDDDEKSLNSRNWPLAAALLFGPSAIYTTFWVLGSLDII